MNSTATDQIAEILNSAKTIAVVGLSNSPMRPSYGVTAYMQSAGYKIIPVNPSINGALGEKALASLLDIPKDQKIDIVNVFRRPEIVPEIVDDAIQLRVSCICLQVEVVHEETAEQASKAGR